MNSKSPAASRSPAVIAWILHLLPWVLVAAEIVCVGVYAARVNDPGKTKPANSVVAAGTPLPVSEKPSGLFTAAEFPEGRLFVTAARAAYQDGAMLISLPKLGIDGLSVSGASDDDALRSGVGLSDFSQMPAEKLGNVVILGWGGYADPPVGASSSEPENSRAADGAASSQPAGVAASSQPADGAASSQPASGAASSQPASGAASSQPASGAASSQPASSAASSQPASSAASSQPASGAASSQPASGAASSQPTGGAASSQPASGAASSQPAGGNAASGNAASGNAASGNAASGNAASGMSSIRTMSSGGVTPFTPRDGKFKGLETLSPGDTATLTYNGTLYSYSYKDTKTFPEENWEPLYIQGFNCLSLVSPVGNGQSVVVRFELTASEDA